MALFLVVPLELLMSSLMSSCGNVVPKFRLLPNNGTGIVLFVNLISQVYPLFYIRDILILPLPCHLLLGPVEDIPLVVHLQPSFLSCSHERGFCFAISDFNTQAHFFCLVLENFTTCGVLMSVILLPSLFVFGPSNPETVRESWLDSFLQCSCHLSSLS